MNRVLLHHTDNDGFGAALVFWMNYHKINLIEFEYGQKLPDLTEYEEIYFCDVTPKIEEIRPYVESGVSVTIIDHHVSFAQELGSRWVNFDNFNFYYDPFKSGCVLAYEYLRGSHTGFWGESAPILLQYIQDRDLWNWELLNSREINAGLSAVDKDLYVWKEYLNDVETLRYIGGHILQEVDKTVRMIAGQVDEIEPGVGMVNCTAYWSEVGNYLIEEQGYETIWLYSYRSDGARKWSIRGNHARQFAEYYGGGGHDRAAGFVEAEADTRADEVVSDCVYLLRPQLELRSP